MSIVFALNLCLARKGQGSYLKFKQDIESWVTNEGLSLFCGFKGVPISVDQVVETGKSFEVMEPFYLIVEPLAKQAWLYYGRISSSKILFPQHEDPAGIVRLPMLFLGELSFREVSPRKTALAWALRGFSVEGSLEDWNHFLVNRDSKTVVQAKIYRSTQALSNAKNAYFGKSKGGVEEIKNNLLDPAVVYTNMLRGIIAPISMEQCAHVHGAEMLKRWRAFEQWEKEMIKEDCCN